MCIVSFISSFVFYDAALCGVVIYNYIKIKDVKATQPIADSLPDRITKVESINLSPYEHHLSLLFSIYS